MSENDTAIDLARQALTKVEIIERVSTERDRNAKEAMNRLEKASTDIRDALGAVVKYLLAVGGAIILLLLTVVGFFLNRILTQAH